MSWGDAVDVRDGGCPDAFYDELTSRLGQDEVVRVVAEPVQWYDSFNNPHKGPGLGLVLTTKRLMIGRERMFGRAKVTEFPTSEFVQCGVEPFQGFSAHWQLIANLQRGRLRLLFEAFNQAEAVFRGVVTPPPG